MAEDKAKTLTGAAAKAAEAKKKRETAKAAEAAAATGTVGEQSAPASETPPTETEPKAPEQTPDAPVTETELQAPASETPPAEVEPKTPAAGSDTGAELPDQTPSKSAPMSKTDTKSKVADDPYQALAAQYAKMYPRNKTFHITSDMQVFLEGDERLARMHQNGIEGGEVKSIKIE